MAEIKVVVFSLGQEEYGVPIDQVVSIERMGSITKIPKMQKHVKGVMELRGKVLPIVDLRIHLAEAIGEDRDENRILIIEGKDAHIGMIVDEAKDVLDISEASIQGISVKSMSTGSLKGVAKLNDGRLIILLDLPQLLSEIDPTQALREINQASTGA